MRLFKNTYRVDSARLQGYDYASPGWYFVTICTKDRRPFFGHVRNGIVGLSPAGCIAAQEWQKTPRVRPYVRLDAWIVMPNHVHGLIGLMPHGNTAVETLRATSLLRNNNDIDRMSAISPDAGSVSVIVRAYKSAVTRRVRRTVRPDFGWQPRFWDRVVRNDAERRRIRCYIQRNPQQWARDRHRPSKVR